MKVNWKPDLFSDEVTKKAMDRLETAAGYVVGYARSIVPVGVDKYVRGELVHRRGALRRTIRVVRLKNDPFLNVRVYAGKAGIIDYAASVEYGTSKMPARPFLRPALRAMRNRIKDIMENG